MNNQKMLALSVCLLAITFISCNDGLKFVVTNKDSTDIDSLHIYVTGNSYLIKDLRQNETKAINLSTEGESDIKLRSDDGKLLTVEVYFEPRQNGTVEATITKDSILSFSQSDY